MTSVKQSLWKYFKIVDLGLIKRLLGICADHNRMTWTITLSQMVYINTIMKGFNPEDTFKVKMPMDMNVHLTKKLTQDSDKEWE